MCRRYQKESTEVSLIPQGNFEKCCHLRMIPLNELGVYTQLSRGISWRMDWGGASDTYFPSTSTLLHVCSVARFRALSGIRSHQAGGWHREKLTRVHWTRPTGSGQRNWQHLPQELNRQGFVSQSAGGLRRKGMKNPAFFFPKAAYSNTGLRSFCGLAVVC